MTLPSDHTLREELADAVVDPAVRVLEAAVTVRLAIGGLPASAVSGSVSGGSTCGGSGGSTASGTGGAALDTLAELETGPAARRCAALVRAVAPAGVVADDPRGWRHRYQVHRVVVPAPALPALIGTLDREWRCGARALEEALRQPRGADGARAVEAARAVWRGALLVCGPGRRHNVVRIRVHEAASARLLVDAAAVLGVPVTRSSRSHVHVLTVGDGDDARRLLTAAGAPQMADRWARTAEGVGAGHLARV